LIGKIGDHPYAVPVSAVERTLPMAALLRLPETPQDVVGVLNLHGAVLSVVDPRPRLGQRTPPFHPDQRLVVLRAGTRYLLWIDEVERIASAAVRPFESVTVASERALVPFLVHLDGETIPVISPRALDPGPVVASAVEPLR